MDEQSNQTKQPAQTQPQTEAQLDARALRLARTTLTGDIRTLILTEMKETKSNLPWNMRPEKEQQEMIDRVTAFAEFIVERAVNIVASAGRRTIPAMLTQISVKDGIKAMIEISQIAEQRHLLMDSVGSPVHIVIADPAEFTGERRPEHPTPDQTSILPDDSGQPNPIGDPL